MVLRANKEAPFIAFLGNNYAVWLKVKYNELLLIEEKVASPNYD